MVRRRRTGGALKSRKFTNAVRRIVNKEIETKHHRVEENGITFSTDGVLAELNGLDSQGVQSGQFVGQEVRQWYLKIRGQVQQRDATNTVRVVVFRPSCAALDQLVDHAMTMSEFFYSSTAPLSLYAPWREPMVDAVYYDKTLVLNQADAAQNKIAQFTIRQKLNGLKLKVIEGAPVGSLTPVSPLIFIGFISDSLPASLLHPRAIYHSTLYYKDA